MTIGLSDFATRGGLTISVRRRALKLDDDDAATTTQRRRDDDGGPEDDAATTQHDRCIAACITAATR